MDHQAATISAIAQPALVHGVGVLLVDRLPGEHQNGISPAFLAQILHRKPFNCAPPKTNHFRWFPIDDLPQNLTITASNATRSV